MVSLWLYFVDLSYFSCGMLSVLRLNKLGYSMAMGLTGILWCLFHWMRRFLELKMYKSVSFEQLHCHFRMSSLGLIISKSRLVGAKVRCLYVISVGLEL